ncbi:thioredoxin-disulfide reductase [Romboutsia sp. 1001713B170207_170306_H8]|uniref:thioredoxin-disulfide reductase n=1 Tax=Romboutsia sp. 1001713B170207_170306_H8 TaxID=2787112 RepID=UPI00082241AB|nr:thioredoxin-disulfide reductase [Romboutsia sp. 1001713B170207_170306_H8]SCH39571.1 Thioredoxin reductase [uncultured Clostridium sp.]
MDIYDLIILGGGPAGLSSGIYSGRSKLNTLIIEKKKVGGIITDTCEIENYPGSIKNETGISLMKRMREQYLELGGNIIKDIIVDVDLKSDIKILRSKERTYKCKSLIIATGSLPKKLNIPKENNFIGKGISYCAICDAYLYTDLEVFVVGSGESAIKEALYIAKYAKKVNIVVRSNKLKCSQYMKDKLINNPKINLIFNKVVEKIDGEEILEKIFLRDIYTNELVEYRGDEDDGVIGLFVFIGLNPKTELFKNFINMDNGYIITDECMATNINGVFAAGDCRYKKIRQVVTATSDGAIAALSAEEYLRNLI